MKTIREEIGRVSLYDLDGPLLNVLEWAKAVVASVPEEYRNRTFLDYESGDGGSLTIVRKRPETDAERRSRQERESSYAISLETIERAKLAELLAKYGADAKGEQ